MNEHCLCRQDAPQLLQCPACLDLTRGGRKINFEEANFLTPLDQIKDITHVCEAADEIEDLDIAADNAHTHTYDPGAISH